MTKQELERHLDIKTILELHKVEIDKNGFMSCPFHAKCKQSMKLYEELNSVACMRSSCSNYRRVFTAFEMLQKLKGCKAEEARIYGKALLLQELEQHRATKKEKDKVVAKLSPKTKLKSIRKQEEGLVNFWKALKYFVLEQEDKQYEFNRNELREKLEISKTTQHNYMKELLSLNYVRQSSGSSNLGYYYQIINWEG